MKRSSVRGSVKNAAQHKPVAGMARSYGRYLACLRVGAGHARDQSPRWPAALAQKNEAPPFTPRDCPCIHAPSSDITNATIEAMHLFFQRHVSNKVLSNYFRRCSTCNFRECLFVCRSHVFSVCQPTDLLILRVIPI